MYGPLLSELKWLPCCSSFSECAPTGGLRRITRSSERGFCAPRGAFQIRYVELEKGLLRAGSFAALWPAATAAAKAMAVMIVDLRITPESFVQLLVREDGKRHRLVRHNGAAQAADAIGGPLDGMAIKRAISGRRTDAIECAYRFSEVVAYHRPVDARLQRAHRAIRNGASPAQRPHLQIITHEDARETELAPQQMMENRTRQRRRAVLIQLQIQHVRAHEHRDARGNGGAERHELGVLERAA